MTDRTYQMHADEHGARILVFDDEGKFLHNHFVPSSDFRPTAYVWVLDNRFRTLFQANSFQVLKWLEEDVDRDRAKQVGVGKDFQILSIREFKELYG